MKREDMKDETAKQGEKRKSHNSVVGTWLKGLGCCTKITGQK